MLPLQANTVVRAQVSVLFLTSMVLLFGARSGYAGTVNFTGINLAQVSSASGQNFGYIEGVNGPAGTLNVKLLSGPIDILTIGSSPDATGFYALQSTPVSIGTPYSVAFTFSSNVDFTITENETLTSYETNIFTVANPGLLQFVSSQDAIVSPLGPNAYSVTGATPNGQGPFGTYVLHGTGGAFQMDVKNQPGFFTLYGSSISLDVIPEPSMSAAVFLTAMFGARRKRR